MIVNNVDIEFAQVQIGKIKMEIKEISINEIKSNPYQTRIAIEKEPLKVLIKSIRERGLFNPISLLKDDTGYIVISGHRRLEAFRKLKKKTIPAIVKPRKKNSDDLMVDLCHENLIREDLTPIEKALSLKLLISQIKSTKDDPEIMISLINSLKNYKRRGDPKFKRESGSGRFEDNDIFKLQKILESLGTSENNASTYLSLLALHNEIKNVLCYNKKGKEYTEKISVKKAEQLARIKDRAYQNFVFQKALFKTTTARHIQALADVYTKKVTNGEWKGFEDNKSAKILNRYKDDIEKLHEIVNSSDKLSQKLASFKVDTLLKLEATLEKELFVSSLVALRRELDTLKGRIDEKLKDRGFEPVKRNVDIIEININPMKDKDTLRFTFPSKVAKDLNLSNNEQASVELKVIGVKRRKYDKIIPDRNKLKINKYKRNVIIE